MKTSGFHFLENRNYLQGATLFDYIINNYVINKYKPREIDFITKKLTDKICLIISIKEKIEDLIPGGIIAEYKDNVNNLLVYETDDPITERVPYNETEITNNCVIDKDKITVSENIPDYSFMKKVIAAYKFLLTSLYAESFGKYLFARIQLSFIPEGKFLIKQDRIISNRFFQGTIMQDNKEIGTIVFGARKE